MFALCPASDLMEVIVMALLKQEFLLYTELLYFSRLLLLTPSSDVKTTSVSTLTMDAPLTNTLDICPNDKDLNLLQILCCAIRETSG